MKSFNNGDGVGQNRTTPCRMMAYWLFLTRLHGTKNNKNKRLAKAHVKISYHQTRGYYVQRSTNRGQS
jgi:hypothetical protein